MYDQRLIKRLLDIQRYQNILHSLQDTDPSVVICAPTTDLSFYLTAEELRSMLRTKITDCMDTLCPLGLSANESSRIRIGDLSAGNLASRIRRRIRDNKKKYG